MGFGPLGTPCSLSLSIFPFRHVVMGRRTLNFSFLVPSGEVTATSLTCWSVEPIRWVWSVVLWWLWRTRERKKKRRSGMMMWGDLITCYTKYKIVCVFNNTRKQQPTEKSLFPVRHFELRSSWKIKKWVLIFNKTKTRARRERCVRLCMQIFFSFGVIMRGKCARK